VICVAEVEDARALAGDGIALAGERENVPIEGFDFGNSPREFLEPPLSHEGALRSTLVMTTTNGTRLLLAAAARCEKVLVASLLNLGAVVEAARTSGAADVAVLKCTPLGGVRRALQVARAAGIPCVISSALETSVGMAAQLALAGALPGLELACGLGTGSLLAGDLVTDPARPVEGFLPVPRTPPIPDPALLDRYAHPDPERVRWWLDRLARVATLLPGSAADGFTAGV